jgi:hypothetical protein
VDAVSEPNEIRDRVDALEEEVARLRENSVVQSRETAATRALAAMADRDASTVHTTLRGYNLTMNALRDTQVQHGRLLSHLVEGQEKHHARLDGLTSSVGALADGQERLAEELARQGDVQARQGEELARQGQELARQGQVQARQGESLAELTTMVRQLVDRSA